MRRHWHYIFLLLLLLCNAVDVSAQERNNLIATKKKLVLIIDISSAKSALDSIFKRAGVSETKIPDLIKGDFSALISDGWMMVKRDNNVIEFDQSLKRIRANPQENTFVITTQIIPNTEKHGYADNILYGVNKFSAASVVELPSGLTRFILPGFLTAKRVFLSGSFNDWSTLKGVMTKTPDGWVIDIKLKPGAYEYKFIAGGRWMTDPNNQINIDDGGGNTNSVYYKYNYTFKLRGFSLAHKIAVAGNFNNWIPDELLFEKKGDGWECPLYVHEGTYVYRFVVDGDWMTDPGNPEKYTDDKGNINSVLKIGETVYFKLNGYPNAQNVYVTGSFNGWKADGIKLKKTIDGWVVPVILQSGNYGYKFIVDGNWITDPANPFHTVVDKQYNSFLAVNPTHTFKLDGYANAHAVYLPGTFNDWNTNEYLMGHTGNGWSISLYLKPGKYLYKFLVDGNWMLDPANKLWEQNQYDTGNSVLWIE